MDTTGWLTKETIVDRKAGWADKGTTDGISTGFGDG